jgi:hypothetical protein
MSQYLLPLLGWRTILHCLERPTTSNWNWLCFLYHHKKTSMCFITIHSFYVWTWFIQAHIHYPLESERQSMTLWKMENLIELYD